MTPPLPPLLPLRLGFLASHNGSGMRAVVEACAAGRLAAAPCLVISNNADSAALTWAAAHGLATRHLSGRTCAGPDALDAAIAGALDAARVSLVVMSGYMRKLGPRTLARYRRRMINIHPSLLPRHGGQGMYGSRVHQAVIEAGDRESGATVHLVDAEYDQGPVLARARVPVPEGDDAAALEQRVRAIEPDLLVDTLRRIAAGAIDLERAA